LARSLDCTRERDANCVHDRSCDGVDGVVREVFVFERRDKLMQLLLRSHT
jgi:hypothetical protein